jgi:hypothetical protein
MSRIAFAARALISALVIFGLLGCGSDMKPERPYSLPFSLDQAGSTVKFEIEVLDKEVGFALDLAFYFSDQVQRAHLQKQIGDYPMHPNSTTFNKDHPDAGLVVPLQLSVKRASEVIFVGRRDTQGSYSKSAGTPGYINRNIYGKVLQKGKYQIEVTNLVAQSAFKGYRVDIKIPGDRKV